MIKLITINVERDEHTETVLPFLVKENADVICVQEVLEDDAAEMAKSLECSYLYMPMTIFAGDNQDLPPRKLGIAIFSKIPFRKSNQAYYYQPSKDLQIFDRTSMETKRATIAHGVLWAEIEKDGKPFRVANTHFTWTPNGMSDQNQLEDVKKLLEIVNEIDEVVLCGDFNTPRGYNEVYPILTENFKDNIPLDFKTTMDANLHRVKNNPAEAERIAKFVVDYIFTTPSYLASNVKQQFGVSDHTAIIANIE